MGLPPLYFQSSRSRMSLLATSLAPQGSQGVPPPNPPALSLHLSQPPCIPASPSSLCLRTPGQAKHRTQGLSTWGQGMGAARLSACYIWTEALQGHQSLNPVFQQSWE